MSAPAAFLTIISGPPGVGKSTVSRALIECFDRVVYLSGDDLFDLVVGRDLSFSDGIDPDPSRTEFLIENVACIAENALRRGMHVVFDYVTLPEDISLLSRRLSPHTPCRYVILTAGAAELHFRDSRRAPKDRMQSRCDLLRDHFEAFSGGPLPLLDTTDLTVAETVAALLTAPVAPLRDVLHGLRQPASWTAS